MAKNQRQTGKAAASAAGRVLASGPAEKYSGVSLGRLVRCCCGGSRVSSVAVRGPVVG